MSLSSKIFGHCQLFPNFLLVPKMLSKIHSDPSPLGYSVFSNGLRKYAIWVYLAKYLDIAVWLWISAWFQRFYQKSNLTLLNWATGFFSSNCLGKYAIWLKCSKIIEHCHLVQNFPPVPEMLLKIQSDTSPLGYSVFFSSNGLRKYTIWVLVDKYLNFTRLFRISPWFQKWYSKFNPNLFHRATGLFFKNGLADFWEKVPPDFKGPFFTS